MDELNTSDRTAQATALLGLRLGKPANTPVGDEPTLEELSALYDGSLDTTRRAQVLSHIAAKRDVYRAFAETAAAHAGLDDSLSSQPDPAQQQVSLTDRLGAWLKSMLRTPALPGGMVAAALVVVLLIPGQQDTDNEGWSDIDKIYNKFGNDWQASPSSLPDRSIRGVGSSTEALPEIQAIYLGLRQGLDALGTEFPEKWLPAIPLDDNVDTLPKEFRAALEATGRLATLARFQCQLDGTEAFFVAAQQSLDELRPQLDLQPSKKIKQLTRVIDQPGSPSERVCDFSNAAVAILSGK